MNFKKWLIPVTCAAIFASCGENSSNKTDSADTVTTVVPPADNTTVNMTNIEVPEATRTSFQAKYPRATNVTWKRYEPIDWFDWEWAGWPTMDSTDYVVNYTDDGVEYWTWYDDKNTWIGTTTTVANSSSLPAAVSKTVDANFPGYTISSIQKENDKDRTAYEIKLTKGTDKAKILVDENGKVMKKTTNIDGTKSKEKTS